MMKHKINIHIASAVSFSDSSVGNVSVNIYKYCDIHMQANDRQSKFLLRGTWYKKLVRVS